MNVNNAAMHIPDRFGLRYNVAFQINLTERHGVVFSGRSRIVKASCEIESDLVPGGNFGGLCPDEALRGGLLPLCYVSLSGMWKMLTKACPKMPKADQESVNSSA